MVLLFLSTGELFFVGLIIVLLFGSKKIPEIARGIGKGIREFKNATSDIQEEIRKTSTEINQTARVDLDKKENKSNDSTAEDKGKNKAS
jgi:sec-independent protein translocase protein TatA